MFSSPSKADNIILVSFLSSAYAFNFLIFPQFFLPFPKKLNFSIKCTLLSGSDFNMNHCNNLSFGKEFGENFNISLWLVTKKNLRFLLSILYQMTKFWTGSK